MSAFAPDISLDTSVEVEGGWVDDEDDEVEGGELGTASKTDNVSFIFIILFK